MNVFNVLIVGCGSIAGGYDEGGQGYDFPLTHVGAYKKHKDFDVVTCCDPDKGRRDEFQRIWDIPCGVASLDDFKQQNIDVVSVCSPTSVHEEQLRQIMDLKPKVVFCEKPVSYDMQRASELNEEFKSSGVLFFVNHTRRWAPDVVELKRDIASGRWGHVRSVSAVYSKGVMNNGSHLVDIVQYLFGSLKVLSAGKPVYDFWDNDPSIPAMLETKGGVPVCFNISNSGDYAFFELEVVTEKCVLRMENGGMDWSLREVVDSPDFPGYKGLGQSASYKGRYREAMFLAIDNISRSLVNGDDWPSSGDTALQAQQVCHSILEIAGKY